MATFPFTVTETNITIMINGAVEKIPRTHAGFPALSAHLKLAEHDEELILTLLDKRKAVARLTTGKVKVIGNTVYYAGEPVHSTLTAKLVSMLEDGYDAAPWANFLDNVMKNPSQRSRECLFEFISRWDSPLTPDGCFVAFKGVNDDYTDCRTGTYDNSPGKTVWMPREDVNEDPNITCAAGLHVCASHYLDSFWTNKRVLAVKVNPADVVAVPYDYKYSKMRVCEYTVLGDIEDDRQRTQVEEAGVVEAAPEENRITPREGIASHGYVVPEGYEINDNEPMEGSLVIRPGSPVLGVVIEMGQLLLDEPEHPQNPEWESGDIARNDADDYTIFFVDFDGTTERFVVEDGEEVELRELDEVDDYYEDELDDSYDEEDEDAVEELTFYHESTGLTFTASDVTAIVDEIGQRGFQREHGVPRTTVQEWLKAIKAQ